MVTRGRLNWNILEEEEVIWESSDTLADRFVDMAGCPGSDVSQMLMYMCFPKVSEGLLLMSLVDGGLLQVRIIETYSVGWVSQIKHLRECLCQIFTQISHQRAHWPDSQMFGGCHTL